MGSEPLFVHRVSLGYGKSLSAVNETCLARVSVAFSLSVCQRASEVPSLLYLGGGSHLQTLQGVEQTNKQKFKVRQPQRAARSKRPNTPSDESKNNGCHTTNQEEYPSIHPTTETADSAQKTNPSPGGSRSVPKQIQCRAPTKHSRCPVSPPHLYHPKCPEHHPRLIPK